MFNSLINNISREIDSFNDYTVKDITVCMAIRASEINPWVLHRLEFLLTYYDPQPNFLIVDFGSEQFFSQKIQEICKNNKNTIYNYIDDKGVFSASKARNFAAQQVETDFIFFTDVDFVYDTKIFERLTDLINNLEIGSAIRRFLPMPIYHVDKNVTEEIESLSSYKEKNKYLTQLGYLGQGTSFKDLFEFVAPYSNAFLIHKRFFELSGGFCDSFRGHGSEDFEYLIRLSILGTNYPLPGLLDKDFYGPLKDSFFKAKDYVGFRRFFELITAPADSLGLKAFHLWHEKPKDKGYWTAQNDWKRDRFNQILGRYYPAISNIINVDYLPRAKKALCLFSDSATWGYFLPFRLLGYELHSISELCDEVLHTLFNELSDQKYDRVLIFNPYMKSHAKYRGLIEFARRVGVDVTVIERGGLPNSIYYANEVVYGDSTYKLLDNILGDYSCNNQEFTEWYIEELKKGEDYLEVQNEYNKTSNRVENLIPKDSIAFFIPLQLKDDMAVTQFTEGYTSYMDFYKEIKEVAKNYPDFYFIIKVHPLSKEIFDCSLLPNIVLADEKDNIHCLIDYSDAVILYNSGVGLLSCIHQKETYNIGNAYYSSNGLSKQVTSITEAVTSFSKKNGNVIDRSYLVKYVDWLLFKKYSWFNAESVIREFNDRKAHGYKNIMVEVFNFEGSAINCGARHHDYVFSPKSYLGWKINLQSIEQELPKKKDVKPEKNIKVQLDEISRDVVKNRRQKVIEYFITPFLTNKKKDKLQRDPQAFFLDSNSKLMLLIKKYFYDK